MKMSKAYLLNTVLFITCLLLANIGAFKLISVGPWTLPGGVLLFPITYIINDVLAEVYGYKMARFSIMLGFAMNLLMVVYFMTLIALPFPVFFEGQSAIALVLGNTPRLLVASLAAYLVGTTLNAKIMVTMRDRANAQKKNGLFLRCVASTLVGETFDSTIFILIAFFGIIPVAALIPMIITQAIFKTVYEIVVFPVTNIVIKKMKSIESLEA